MKSRVTGIASMAAVVLAVVGLAIGSTFARATNQDIVDTAVAAGQFKTLAAALQGGRSGRHAERSRSVYGVRADRCGVRQAAGRHGGEAC